MSILNDGERQRVAAELLFHKEEIARISNDVINDIIIRKQKLDILRQKMLDKPEIFTAADIADLDAVELSMLEKIQEVYDIATG